MAVPKKSKKIEKNKRTETISKLINRHRLHKTPRIPEQHLKPKPLLQFPNRTHPDIHNLKPRQTDPPPHNKPLLQQNKRTECKIEDKCAQKDGDYYKFMSCHCYRRCD